MAHHQELAAERMPEFSAIALGSRIKEYRVAHGYSLQRLGDRVGCSKAHLWEIERGRSSNPTLALLWALAEEFGCTLDELAGRAPIASHAVTERNRLAERLALIARIAGRGL